MGGQRIHKRNEHRITAKASDKHFDERVLYGILWVILGDSKYEAWNLAYYGRRLLIFSASRQFRESHH